MKHDSRIQFVAALAAVAGLAASAWLTTAVSAEAGRAQLGYADRAEESDPPEVAVGIALGAFRGLFVNILWLRAERLKRDGKFFESMELARTITRLQPRFPRVWAFQAWNMAYNISVATRSAEERWMWVNAGVNLLRSQGLRKNPNDTLLHKELAWIFNHKIQGYADDANAYYKRRVAEEWTVALGKPPPRPATLEEAKGLFGDWLQVIVDGADTLEEAQRREPKVAALVQRIASETGLPLGLELLRAFEIELALRENWAVREGIIAARPGLRNEGLARLLDDPELLPAWRTLLPHLRKRALIDVYNMEPSRMARYTRKWGPLDWRHPSTHALYWTLRGLEEGQERINTADADFTNTDRVSLHAAQELARYGDLSYDILFPDESYIALPDVMFIPVYGQLLAELEKRGDIFESRGRAHRLFAMGYENFLRDAIRFFHRSGDRAKAEEYYTTLRTWDGINLNEKPDLEIEFQRPLDQFVQKDLEERLTSPQVALQEINGALISAFLRGAVRGDRAVFDAQLAYARSVHEYFMGEQLRRTLAGGGFERMELFPRAFEDAAAQTLVGLLQRGTMSVTDAGLIYRRVPLWLQQAAYDRLLLALGGAESPFGEDAENAVRAMFPEPPGMEEWRAARAALQEGSDTERKEGLQIEKK